MLVEISPDPVAAASLGQVYRGRLRDGGAQVAVKVQRPKVLASIGLDLFVMRNVAAAIQRIPSVRYHFATCVNSLVPAIGFLSNAFVYGA